MHLLENGLKASTISSESQDWENIKVKEFHLPPGQLKHQSQTEHGICMCLASHPFNLLQIKGDRRYTSLYTKGDLSITPAGLPFLAQWDGNDRYLWIRLYLSFMEKIATEALEVNPNCIQLLPEFRVRNPQIS